MTHVKALQAGHSSQGTFEPITPELLFFEKQNFENIFWEFFVCFWYIFFLFKKFKLNNKGDIVREIFF